MAASRGNLRIGWGKKNKYILELSVRKYKWVFINPSHPNISLHILYTLLYSFVYSRASFVVIISFILMTLIRDQQLYCKEKLDAGHS